MKQQAILILLMVILFFFEKSFSQEVNLSPEGKLETVYDNRGNLLNFNRCSKRVCVLEVKHTKLCKLKN